MVVGIERLVSWLSSFVTLYPGDVLHMATMGMDGLAITPEMTFGPDDYLEGEIERVGTLRVPVVREEKGDWRSPDDPSVRVHPSPAVRDLIERGATDIASPLAWTLNGTRHFWTTYGNYAAAQEMENMAICPLPRILNGPASALAPSGQAIRLATRARTLAIGPELAFVVGKLATRVLEQEAESYILGYLALASILDSSFSEPLRDPATPQERNMPGVYGRWGDGYNVVSAPPVPMPASALRGRAMKLSIEGIGDVAGNTDEYVVLAPKILAFLSRHITLFPGDVVTLGRVAGRLAVAAGRLQPGACLRASIEGIGAIESALAG
jgi:2-keto-4-pentenoate hydratase/2-oxohepta-3-ene-1,7-dioic acid hydratase in catechol pathway